MKNFGKKFIVCKKMVNLKKLSKK